MPKNIFDTKTIMVLISTVVLHLAVAIVFMVVNGGRRDDYSDTVNKLRAKWEAEDRETASAREVELQKKFGAGKLDRIAFDPRMDIHLLLLKMSEAVMAPEYKIDVKVDRFTEFTIFVDVFNMPPADVLAGYLKDLFSRVDDKYVYQVIFTDTEHFYIVDRDQMDKIRDWKHTSLSDVERYCFSG